MAEKAILTISSKNYSSWSLRGWLLTKLAGIDFEERYLPPDDPDVRAEILLLSSSILTPRLEVGEIVAWDTLAIAEVLNELAPEAGLLPDDKVDRAHCRSICGEMHSGFTNLRSALPMNIKADMPKFKIWSRAKADIERIVTIWTECLEKSGGPFLFGKKPCMADAMYAPVVLRFRTYHVAVPPICEQYCKTILAVPALQEWINGALTEPDDIDEFEMEF